MRKSEVMEVPELRAALEEVNESYGIRYDIESVVLPYDESTKVECGYLLRNRQPECLVVQEDSVRSCAAETQLERGAAVEYSQRWLRLLFAYGQRRLSPLDEHCEGLQDRQRAFIQGAEVDILLYLSLDSEPTPPAHMSD